jgi:hypothetical protein
MEDTEISWTEQTDQESGRKYYVGTTWKKPMPTPPKKGKSGSGLSALSRQLRDYQSKNSQLSSEIERLTRQIKLTTELKGTSVLAVKEALKIACEGEAHHELLREISSLKSKLSIANKQNDQQTGEQFMKEATDKTIATLELRIGEFEELEETLRNEISNIYTRLSEESSKVSRLESLVSSLHTDLKNSEAAKAAAEAAAEAAATATTSNQNQSNGKQLIQQEHQQHQQHQQQQQQQHANEIQHLQTRIAKLEQQLADMNASKSKLEIIEEQLNLEKKNSNLKKAQRDARFMVQNERIHDLTGQLSSLYTAFELLQQEHISENKRMAELKKNLHASDSQLALLLHKEMKQEEESSRDQGSHGPSPSQSLSPPSPPLLPPPHSPTHSLIHHGFLFKKPISGGKKKSSFRRGWKKRYFQLEKNRGVGYQLTYREKPESKKIKGTIGPITKFSQISPVTDSSTQPFAFAVHLDVNSESSTVLYAAAVTIEEEQEWLNVLRDCTTDREHCSNASLSANNNETKQTTDRNQQEAADHAMALRMAREFQ